ncbi:MAG: YebC/PmpR family DNA-binding transcriptional regulator, partial [Chloroflexota bacterium]
EIAGQRRGRARLGHLSGMKRFGVPLELTDSRPQPRYRKVVRRAAIDAGAEDVETENDLITVYTAPRRFEAVKRALEQAGIAAASAEVSMRPTSTVPVEGDTAQKVLRLVEALEDLDAVQKVHANFDIPEEVLQAASA